MELPIDHFRLLGVGPNADAQAVLHTLQQRLNRVTDQRFSAETLKARADLLRASADLLADPSRRASYESELTTLNAKASGPVVPALEFPSSREVAGLLLLLEADQPLECFEIARHNLQPPQAPALGSNREADLTLLAGLACLEGASELQRQRRYEGAAKMLQDGVQLLQRMGQWPELREAIQAQLEQLVPYRILDLLSRDLSSISERREGMALLEQLVQRRGGLEGNGTIGFSDNQFQTFFKQIRGFLTVQEQVDLFSRWGDAGSATADFLASIALTASGFAQRKPERIAAARQRLQASQRPGIEALLANLSLLLGEVDTAKQWFDQSAGQELQDWASRQSDDPLGQLCAYCRDWLSRDVLAGYRDLDVEADLEAYFSDRDVLHYVEREDRRSGRSYAASRREPDGAPPAASQDSAQPASWSSNLGTGGLNWDSSSFAWGGGAGQGTGDQGTPPPAMDDDEDSRESQPLWSMPPLRLPAWDVPSWLPEDPRLLWALGVGSVVVLAGVASLLFRPANRSVPTPPPAMLPEPSAHRSPPAAAAKPPVANNSAKDTPATASGTVPLKAANPSEAQLQALLQTWLQAKAAVLAGQPAPALLPTIARPNPIADLENQRRDDLARQERQELQVQVASLQIEERSDDRIVVNATLRYSDSRRNASGQVISRTAPTTLQNSYVFARDGDNWRLVDTRHNG